jgi:hypothetical protein
MMRVSHLTPLMVTIGRQSARGPVLTFVLRTFMRYDLHNTRVETRR